MPQGVTAKRIAVYPNTCKFLLVGRWVSEGQS
jgi:hypothetical protein